MKWQVASPRKRNSNESEYSASDCGVLNISASQCQLLRELCQPLSKSLIFLARRMRLTHSAVFYEPVLTPVMGRRHAGFEEVLHPDFLANGAASRRLPRSTAGFAKKECRKCFTVKRACKLRDRSCDSFGDQRRRRVDHELGERWSAPHTSSVTREIFAVAVSIHFVWGLQMPVKKRLSVSVVFGCRLL